MLLVCSAKFNADVPATGLRGDWRLDANYLETTYHGKMACLKNLASYNFTMLEFLAD